MSTFNATKAMWKARLGFAFGWLASLLTYIGLCPHDWRDVQTVRVFESDRDKRALGTKYVQRCECCRKYRSFLI